MESGFKIYMFEQGFSFRKISSLYFTVQWTLLYAHEHLNPILLKAFFGWFSVLSSTNKVKES